LSTKKLAKGQFFGAQVLQSTT